MFSNFEKNTEILMRKLHESFIGEGVAFEVIWEGDDGRWQQGFFARILGVGGKDLK